MNTLSFPSLRGKIARSAAVGEILKALEGGNYPLEIDAAEGAFPGILISLIFSEGNLRHDAPRNAFAAGNRSIFVVVP